MQLRKLLCCLLLLSSALTIALIPEASSQQFTTVTSYLTETQTSTNYYASYYSVTSTSAGILSTTAYLSYATGLYNAECYTFLDSFDSEGTTIHVHYQAAQPVTLYVLDMSDANNWWATGVPCHADSNRFQSSASSSADFNMYLPSSDNPYILFMVSYPNNGGFNFVSSTFYLTIGPIVTASSSAATVSIPIVLTATNTMTMTSVSQLSFTDVYGWILAAIAIVVVVLAMWLVLKLKRAGGGSKQSKSAEPEKVEPEAKKAATKSIECKICKKRMTLVNPDRQIWYCKNDQRAYYGLEDRTEENVTESGLLSPNANVPAKNFCIECGKELELGSKFCNNCGTRQL